MLSSAIKTLITSIGFTLGFFAFLPSSYFNLALSNQANQGYVPPAKDREQQKATSSGSRGCPNEPVDIIPLIPGDLTLTTISANPNFLFLVKSNPNYPVHFSLVEPGTTKSPWKEELSLERSGVLSVSIPQNVSLDVGKNYVWNLKVICNPRRPSQSWYIRAIVKRVLPSTELMHELTKANSKSEEAAILASNGIWYDAISISYHTKNESKATSYFQQLLAQIGLSLP